MRFILNGTLSEFVENGMTFKNAEQYMLHY